MWEKQRQVEKFFQENELGGTTPFRILDLVSEIGEVAKDATKSADYGQNTEKLEIKKDEIGDTLFSLLAVANDLDIDVEEALEESIQKYESRIEEKGDPGSK